MQKKKKKTEKERKQQQIRSSIFNQICSLLVRTQDNDILLTLPYCSITVLATAGAKIQDKRGNTVITEQSLCWDAVSAPAHLSQSKSRTRKLAVNEAMLVLLVEEGKQSFSKVIIVLVLRAVFLHYCIVRRQTMPNQQNYFCLQSFILTRCPHTAAS